MAFGDKQRQINQLHEELEQFNRAKPYLDDALAIHNEVAEVLQNPANPLTAAEIAAQAVAHVRRQRLQEAYETLSTQLRDEQEQLIFEEVLHDIREKEGEAIRQKVEQSLHINPNLKRELAKKARRLLWQEAESEMMDEIKQQERAHAEIELARQKQFNQSTLEFSRDARLHLASDALLSTYKEGDILEISYSECTCHNKHRPAVYSYAGDEENVTWRYVSGSIGGVRHSAALSTNLQLYRLGSLTTSEWGKEPERVWDTLLANHEVHVQFYTDDDEKIDRLQNKCPSRSSQINQVTLFTPLAYAHHREQQQN